MWRFHCHWCFRNQIAHTFWNSIAYGMTFLNQRRRVKPWQPLRNHDFVVVPVILAVAPACWDPGHWPSYSDALGVVSGGRAAREGGQHGGRTRAVHITLPWPPQLHTWGLTPGPAHLITPSAPPPGRYQWLQMAWHPGWVVIMASQVGSATARRDVSRSGHSSYTSITLDNTSVVILNFRCQYMQFLPS